jgi:hypothetical protein
MQKEKVLNPKVSIFLFSKEKPTGEMFNFVGGKESDQYQEMLENGWVDTPARLNLPKESDVGITIDQAKNADPADLIKLIESFGFFVLTPEQLKAEAVKMASIALDISKFSNEEFIAEADRRGLKEQDGGEDSVASIFRTFEENPKSLTKEELKAFGNDSYALSLTMNHSEQTMIDKITEAMNA